LKKLHVISLVFTTLIISVLITSSCSNHNKVTIKQDKIERRLKLTSDPLTNEFLKGQPQILIGNPNSKIKIDSLTRKLAKLNHQIHNAWYIGDNRPYKRILVGLKRQGYDITNYTEEGDNKKVLCIKLENEWNREEVNKIKNIVARTIFSEPKVFMSQLPDGRQVTSMTWTSPKYITNVYQTGIDESIHLRFETK
jgi:hypothetical protein